MSESRIDQAKQAGKQAIAATDEMRTIARDILEQTDCSALVDACRYLNWALSAFDRADAQLALKEQP